MTADLRGKVALVTGASSGFGWRFAQLLAAAGAKVVLAAPDADDLARNRDEIARAGGTALVVPMDVTDLAAVRASVATAEKQLGGIDILLNNAGVNLPQLAVEVEEADYDFAMDVNCKGAFFVAQTVARSMIARKTPGRIINIASLAGLRVLARTVIYGTSKAALIHLTKALAAEWARYGINVNAICPGYIQTAINRDFWQTEGGQKLIGTMPRRRVGLPEDLDGIVMLLVSDAARFINGAIISVDDGVAAS